MNKLPSERIKEIYDNRTGQEWDYSNDYRFVAILAYLDELAEKDELRECECGCEGNNKDFSPSKIWDKKCIYHLIHKPKEGCYCGRMEETWITHRGDAPCYVTPK